jgi:hypothetical protein
MAGGKGAFSQFRDRPAYSARRLMPGPGGSFSGIHGDDTQPVTRGLGGPGERVPAMLPCGGGGGKSYGRKQQRK